MRRPLAALLASAALFNVAPMALAATLDLGAVTVTRTDLDEMVGVPYTVFENGHLILLPTSALTFGGVFQDGATTFILDKKGFEILTLTGANTYSGETRIISGILAAGADNTLSPFSPVRVGDTLELGGYDQTVAGLVGSGNVSNASGGLATLTLNPGTTQTFSGTITEAPGSPLTLVKIGADTQNMIGENSYSGGTTLVDGTLGVGSPTSAGTGTIEFTGAATLMAIGSSANLANGIVLTADGTISTGGNTMALSGAISGAGRLTKAGNGTLILNNGASSYTGGTTLAQGEIDLGGDNVLGDVSAILTVAGGSKLGSAVAAVTLANAVHLDADLSVAPAAGGTITLSGVLSGAGGLYLADGPGTLLLSGANTYSGNTILGSGTLGIGSSGALGGSTVVTGPVAVTIKAYADATIANLIRDASKVIVDTNGHDLTLAGAVNNSNSNPANAGALVKAGAGTLTLGATNNYSLGTTITGGTLSVSSDGKLGNVAGALTFDGGVLRVTGATFSSTTRVVTLLGNGGFDIVQAGNNFILSQAVSGAGGITKLGAGRLTLSGANTYTGDVVAVAGTLAVTTGAALGSGGNLALQGGTVLAGADNLSFANNVIVSSGTINTAANTLTLSGDVSGAGTLTKTGSGVLILGGSNSYAGTALNAGEIHVGQSGGLGSGSAALAAGTAIRGLNTLELGNAFVLAGAGTFDDGGDTLTLSGNISGPGSIHKVGAGTLALSGGNSFMTGVVLNQGTLKVGSNTALGDPAGVLAMAQGTVLQAGASVTLANDLSLADNGATIDTDGNELTLNGTVGGGTATLTKSGAGTLTLNASNSYGGTFVDAGLIRGSTANAFSTGGITLADGAGIGSSNDFSLTNQVILLGAGTIDSSNNLLTLDGIVSGAGSLVKVGPGTLVLTAANTYAGGTVLNAGNLALGTSTSLGSGPVILNAGTIRAAANNLTLANNFTVAGSGTFDTQANTLTIGGTTAGPGSLTKTGSGTLILAGASTRTGTTTISAGTVSASVATFGGGNVVDNGALVFNQTVDATYRPSISATGTVSKIGAGNLTLTGSSSVSGATSVSGGRLTVNGALTASTITLGSGTSLAGIGSVAGLVATSGSTVSPGLTDGAVGTLTVTGGATFQAGSTFAVNVTPAAADRLTVGGAASLAGNLTLTARAGQYLFNTSYTLLSAAGGRTGTFTAPSLTLFGPAFEPTLSYGLADLVLKLVPARLTNLLNPGASRNVVNAAAAFDRATAAGFNPQAFYTLFLQGAAMNSSINQLTGEIHAADRRQAITDTRYIREAALDRLGAGIGGGTNGGRDAATTTADGDRSTSLWGRAIGSWGKTDSDGNGASIDIDTKGVMTGVDTGANGWRAGGLFNYLESKVDTSSLGTSKVKTTGGGVYAGYRSAGGVAFGAGATIGSVQSSSSRSITVPGLGQTLNARTGGTSYQAFGDVSFDLAAAENTRIEPFARLAYVAYHVDGVAESGGVAAVSGGKAKYDATFATLGLRGVATLGGTASLRASLGYQHTGGDRSPVASLAIAGTNQPAAIRAVGLDKNSAAAELGVDVGIGRNAAFGIGYSGVISKNNSDHGLKATLSVGF